MQEMQVWSLGREDPLEMEMATHSGILAWRIPCRATVQGVAESDTTERRRARTHSLAQAAALISLSRGSGVWLESSLTLGETRSSSWCASSSPAGIREGTRESTRWGRESERRKGTMVPFLLSSMGRRNGQLISYDPRALQACRSLACCTSRGRF